MRAWVIVIGLVVLGCRKEEPAPAPAPAPAPVQVAPPVAIDAAPPPIDAAPAPLDAPIDAAPAVHHAPPPPRPPAPPKHCSPCAFGCPNGVPSSEVDANGCRVCRCEELPGRPRPAPRP